MDEGVRLWKVTERRPSRQREAHGQSCRSWNVGSIFEKIPDNLLGSLKFMKENFGREG